MVQGLIFVKLCRYFQEVLQSQRLPPDCNEIQLSSDASWTIISVKKESSTQNLSPKREAAAAAPAQNVETLSDETGKFR